MEPLTLCGRTFKTFSLNLKHVVVEPLTRCGRTFNTFSLNPKHVVAAFLGIAGASTYAAKSKKDVDFVNDLDKNYSFDDFGVSWAFGLTITGCVLNLCAATLIALYNKPTAPANPGTTLSFSAAVTGSAPVVVPGTTHVYQQQPGSNPYSVAMVQSTSPPPAYYPGLQAQGPTQPVVVYTADPQGKN